jgi:hypothetical protein
MATAKPKQKTFDVDPETGIATERDMTADEQADFDAAVAALEAE